MNNKYITKNFLKTTLQYFFERFRKDLNKSMLNNYNGLVNGESKIKYLGNLDQDTITLRNIELDFINDFTVADIEKIWNEI